MAKNIVDIPFKGKNNPRFLGWIIVLMLIITMLFLSSSFILENAVNKWDLSFSNGFCVELSPADIGDHDQQSEITQQRIVLDILNELPQIESTTVIATTNLASMIDVILGRAEKNYENSMPTIIDVRLKKGAYIDLRSLEKYINEKIPGTVIKSERNWCKQLFEITDRILMFSLIIALFIFAITIMITFFSTHAQMVVNRKAIEILNLIGAPTGYVIKQFAGYITRLVLNSGIIALIISLMILGLLHMWLIMESETMNTVLIDYDSYINMLVVGGFITIVNTVVMRLITSLTVRREISSYDVMENTNTVFV